MVQPRNSAVPEDHKPEWIKDVINISRKYHVKKQSILKHNFINIGSLSLLMFLSALVINLSFQASNIIEIFFEGVSLGILLFGLAVLVVHESSHSMFLLSKNTKKQEKLNLFFGRLFSCIVEADFYDIAWKNNHNIHHAHENETDDPQNYNITTKDLFKRRILYSLIPGSIFILQKNRKRNIFNIDEGNPYYHSKISKNELIAKILFLCFWFLFGIINWILTKNFSYFFVVLIAWHYLFIINEIKGTLEHGGEHAIEHYREFRSKTTLFLLRPVFFPFNISIHFEHHLNMRIPWYLLNKFRKEIAMVIPDEFKSKIYNHGIKDILAQINGHNGMVFSRHPNVVSTLSRE